MTWCLIHHGAVNIVLWTPDWHRGAHGNGQPIALVTSVVDVNGFDDPVLYGDTWLWTRCPWQCSLHCLVLIQWMTLLLVLVATEMDWSLPLYAFISSFIHGSWTLTWNCDWDIWFPSYYVLGCDWHAWGIIISECVFYSLVILHHMAVRWFRRLCYALTLLDAVGCRAELSALHRVLGCWNLFWLNKIFWRRSTRFGKVLWTRRTLYRTSERICFVLDLYRDLVIHGCMSTRTIWEVLEVDQFFVASWICDSTQLELIHQPFRKKADFEPGIAFPQ